MAWNKSLLRGLKLVERVVGPHLRQSTRQIHRSRPGLSAEDMSFAWGYCRHNGPKIWPEHYPAAKGKRQTPIDILPGQATFDVALKDKPLKFTYVPQNAKTLVNTGASWEVRIEGNGSIIEGGPLPVKYELKQFHSHWGNCSTCGSEHVVEGKPYAAELHFVHWNSGKYNSFGDAAKEEDGLTVVGVFVEAGSENKSLAKLTDLMAKVQFKGQEAVIHDGFDPTGLFPADQTRYWTYPGSLTTPPCYESVTWILFKDPIQASEAQLNAFRSLRSHQSQTAPPNDELKGIIMDNFRPPMELNNREVRASFRKFFA